MIPSIPFENHVGIHTRNTKRSSKITNLKQLITRTVAVREHFVTMEKTEYSQVSPSVEKVTDCVCEREGLQCLTHRSDEEVKKLHLSKAILTIFAGKWANVQSRL